MGNSSSSVSRVSEFSILSENQNIVDYSQRHHHWTSFGSSRCKKILDRDGKEVAIQSIANPEYTTYVVISREEERFVNEIQDHKQELRSVNCSQTFTNQEGMKKEK